jgi:threonyl-tRNA synthetase
VPFLLLAGDKDVEAGAVSFRFPDRTQVNGVPKETAIAAILRWIGERRNDAPTAENVGALLEVGAGT